MAEGLVITAEHFTRAVGRDPQDDDLDRANCALAGTAGHYSCGWDLRLNYPVWMTSQPMRDKLND